MGGRLGRGCDCDYGSKVEGTSQESRVNAASSTNGWRESMATAAQLLDKNH